jgi:hypothetical protein
MIFRTCEPLKLQTQWWKEIPHSFPLTLFADACNADAPEALDFNAVKII